MAPQLGKLETQFFAYTQMRRLSTVRTGELGKPLGLTREQELELLRRLARSGLIVRVRQGFYLVPPQLPPGGKWSPGEGLAIKALIEDRSAQYQICGPNAFYRYGWDDQVPNRLYAYNDRISGDRKIGAVNLTLIKVARTRLGAIEAATTPNGVEVVYSSKARSLMDAVYDWSRFNSLPRGYDWIRSELTDDSSFASELVKVTLRFGNKGTIRRIGWLLDTQSVAESQLRKLEKALRPSSSQIPWIPTRPKRGTVDQRWGVIVNDAG